MQTRPEQHGDVVIGVDIATTPIVRYRHTWTSALIAAVALLLLLLSMWLRSRGQFLAASGTLVAAVAGQWFIQRWQIEEHFPRPRTTAQQRRYRLLQGLEIAGIVGLLAWWFVWIERTDGLWIAAAGFALGTAVGWWAIERAYRRFFEQIADEPATAQR